MKVRIKIIEKNNGTKHFIPQAKDGFSVFGLIVNFFTIIIFGKRWYRWYGLTKVEQSNLNDLLGIKEGEIIHCSDDEATRFLDYDSAMDFMREYIKQEKLAIYSSKEEANLAKTSEEREKYLIKGEKIKKVKYIKIKSA